VFCDDRRETEMGDEDGNAYGGYERIMEVRGTTCLIGFRRPCIGVSIRQIGTSACRIRNG